MAWEYWTQIHTPASCEEEAVRLNRRWTVTSAHTLLHAVSDQSTPSE